MENYYAGSSTRDSIVSSFCTEHRTRFQATSGFEELSVYVNYAHGDEGARAWYSQRKLAKLASLKRTWDPEQLFSWYDPVPIYY